MRIKAIHEKTIALSSPMGNAAMSYDEMTGSLLALVTDRVRDGRPVVGYAFDSIGRYGHGGLARERFIPRLLNAAPESLLDEAGLLDPRACFRTMMRNEKPGGDGERAGAIGLIDMAIWDALAKVEGVPLWRLLADRYNGGKAERRIWAYGSGGHYYPGRDVDGLVDELKRYRDLGFKALKMKVAGAPIAEDRRRLEAALKLVEDSAHLAVDACAGQDAPAAHRLIAELAPYRLAWVEEPVEPLDYAGLAAVAKDCPMPIGTGENCFSLADMKNLVSFGGLRSDRDWLQMDPPLAYGLVEYLAMIDWLEARGWSRKRMVPHAGHLFSLNLAIGLGLGGYECAPDGKALAGGFAEGTRVDEGHVVPPGHPGIGFEHKANLWALFRDLAG
jgi:L-alanine-DL-glutamate epimerase-like enolase superfamily enzyme